MSLRIVELFTKDGQHFKVGDPRPVVEEDVVAAITHNKLDSHGYRGGCYVITFGETPIRETVPDHNLSRLVIIEEKEVDEASIVDKKAGKVKK